VFDLLGDGGGLREKIISSSMASVNSEMIPSKEFQMGVHPRYETGVTQHPYYLITW
jgi:hypothetical protein